MLHKRGDGNEPAAARPPAVAPLADEMKKAGVLVDRARARAEPQGACAFESRTAGAPSPIFGPFAESKELIAGYSLLRIDTLEEVMALGFRFGEILGDDVEMDVRVVADS